MSSSETRVKLVTATAINMVMAINQIIIDNARKNKQTELQLPSMFDRAFLIFHENGTVPLLDYLSEE